VDALTAVRWLVAVSYVGLAVIALVQARRNQRAAPWWLSGAFGALGLALINARLGELLGAPYQTHYATRITLTLIVLFPYCLYRFSREFVVEPRRWFGTIALVLTVLPPIAGWLAPGPYDAAENPSPLIGVSLGLLALQWAGLMGAAAIGMWRAGAAQAPAVRGRMRLLGGGTAILGVALLVAIGAATGDVPGVAAFTQITGLTAAVAFYLGFAPPRVVRALWRNSVDEVLRSAEADLVRAVEPSDVGDVIVPRVRGLLNAQSAALVLDDDQLVATDGLEEDAETEFLAGCHAPAERGMLVADLRNGCLAARPGRLAPYYGRDEQDLLDTFALVTDLALERAELLAQERRSNERLQSAHAELEALVYGISHDLKNPIISLLGYAELLKEDYGAVLDEDGQHFLDRMTVSAGYMHELLNDLLELSRIGRVQSEPEEVDLAEVAAEVAEDAEQRHPGLTVRTRELSPVVVNPVRLRQLLTNLVENAARHGGRDDLTIEIAEEPSPPDRTRFVVRDDGVGIPQEHRERVFGIFERLSGGDAEEGGTGIGLAICRRIVEAHGGEIALRDVPSGTEFEITLPAPDATGGEGGPPGLRGASSRTRGSGHGPLVASPATGGQAGDEGDGWRAP
jgi:signal transduction histidine kinase